MPKQIIKGEELRNKLKIGVNTVADITKSTLGPRGRNVLLARHWQTPVITKDGKTTNAELELEDPVENLGGQLVREASAKSEEQAGDGTTTVTVLTQAIVEEGFKLVAASTPPLP